MEISFRNLRADEMECRVGMARQSGVSLLLYKDARVDMKLLDETVGPMSWGCSYEEIHGRLFCTVWVMDGDTVVSKQDCGVPSNTEAEKGEASDAFKRACFKWGIGRELYTAPRIFIPAASCNIKQDKGRYKCFDRFRVLSVGYGPNGIEQLTIWNDSRGTIAYEFGDTPKSLDAAKRELWTVVKRKAQRDGKDAEAEWAAAVSGAENTAAWYRSAAKAVRESL